MNESISTRFSNAGEVEQISEYRQFNLLALISLLLGLASAAVLASSFLLVLPLFAIFLGACGLVAYHRRQDIGGRWQAWSGITLGLFFFAWFASLFALNRCTLYSQSFSVARQYLALVVKGEQEIAHQAMMSVSRRQGAGLSVDEYYAIDEEARDAMNDVFTSQPFADLLGLGENSEIELVKNVTIKRDPAFTTIEHVVRISPPDGEPRVLWVSTVQEFDRTMPKPSWMVNDLKNSKDDSVSPAERLSRALSIWLSKT